MKQLISIGMACLTLFFLMSSIISCGGEGDDNRQTNGPDPEPSPDPVISEAAVCTASENQQYPVAVSDASGGAIVAWIDERFGPMAFRAYSQRINVDSPTGMWDADGIPVRGDRGEQISLQVVHDGSDAAIYVWVDTEAAICGTNVYAKKLDAATATAQWVVQAISGWINHSLDVVPDGTGGVVFTLEQHACVPSNSAIIAQRLSGASGALQWSGTTGVEVCSSAQDPKHPRIVSDGNGGAIVTWDDARSGNRDIYAQRKNASDGSPLWTVNGVAIAAVAGEQTHPRIVAARVDSVIIVWQDNRSGDNDIYAQCINIVDGTPCWAANGVAVCSAAGDQASPMIVPDGSGGAIITWQDGRDSDNDIYAQRIDATSGAPVWTTNGVPVSTVDMEQVSPRIIRDDYGYVIVSWEDYRDGSTCDIYAQKLDIADGSVQWTENGIALTTRSGNQSDHCIVPNDTGGAIIVWKDDGGLDEDIYAQEIRSDGTK